MDFVKAKRESSLRGERSRSNRRHGNPAVSREQICDYGVCEECRGLGGVGDSGDGYCAGACAGEVSDSLSSYPLVWLVFLL